MLQCILKLVQELLDSKHLINIQASFHLWRKRNKQFYKKKKSFKFVLYFLIIYICLINCLDLISIKFLKSCLGFGFIVLICSLMLSFSSRFGKSFGHYSEYHHPGYRAHAEMPNWQLLKDLDLE